MTLLVLNNRALSYKTDLDLYDSFGKEKKNLKLDFTRLIYIICFNFRRLTQNLVIKYKSYIIFSGGVTYRRNMNSI